MAKRIPAWPSSGAILNTDTPVRDNTAVLNAEHRANTANTEATPRPMRPQPYCTSTEYRG